MKTLNLLEEIEEKLNQIDVFQIKTETLLHEFEKIKESKSNNEIELKGKQYKVELIKKEMLKNLKDSEKLFHQINYILENKINNHRT